MPSNQYVWGVFLGWGLLCGDCYCVGTAAVWGLLLIESYFEASTD